MKTIFLIVCLASAVVGMGLTSIIRPAYKFYDGEGNILPYHAVDSLVRYQFVKPCPATIDTLNKYFEFSLNNK